MLPGLHEATRGKKPEAETSQHPPTPPSITKGPAQQGHLPRSLMCRYLAALAALAQTATVSPGG